jgi:hypothetical protein
LRFVRGVGYVVMVGYIVYRRQYSPPYQHKSLL